MYDDPGSAQEEKCQSTLKEEEEGSILRANRTHISHRGWRVSLSATFDCILIAKPTICVCGGLEAEALMYLSRVIWVVSFRLLASGRVV